VAHEAADSVLRDSVGHAHHAGDLLQQVKARLKHGEFGPWMEANCPFKPATARLYMKIAAEWDLQRVGNLSLREVARRLYAPDQEEAGSDHRETVEPLGRITHDYVTALKCCLIAIPRAHKYPDRQAVHADKFSVITPTLPTPSASWKRPSRGRPPHEDDLSPRHLAERNE
jgi:hypothetical protein